MADTPPPQRAAPRPAAPARGAGGTELRLARTAALAVAGVGAPALAVAGLVEGTPGVLGAGAGLLLVLVLFGAAALAQAAAARFLPSALMAVVGAGVGARLLFYVVALDWFLAVPTLHARSLAVTAAVGFVVTLAAEMYVIARTPQFFWLQTTSATSQEG